MTRLYLYYDSRCSLCRWLRDWVVKQLAWWPITPVPAEADADELTVVASDGRYWRGDDAWLIVLFALKDYRDWAKRLANPVMLPLARQAFATLSGIRQVCRT